MFGSWGGGYRSGHDKPLPSQSNQSDQSDQSGGRYWSGIRKAAWWFMFVSLLGCLVLGAYLWTEAQ